MNILLINHYAGSPKHGMEYRPYYLAREWGRMGHNVTIVAASFSHLRSKQPIVNGNISEELIDDIQYIWLKTPSYKGNSIRRVQNMLTFIGKLIALSRKLSKKFKQDVVIASSTYPLDIYPAYLISRFLKAKLIFEVHDLWPLTPMELGGMSKWHPFIIMMQIAEDFAYKKTDRVISILPKALDYMVSRGLACEKFVHIPNGIDIDEWQSFNEPLPPQHQETIERLKQEGKFLVCYAGSHGVSNALDYFVESAVYLKDLPIALVLVGQGPEKEKLQKYVVEHNLNNVIFLPPVLKNSIPELLSKMDILYIGWRRSPLYRFGVSPNKLFDYMMAGKPIIHAIEAGNDLVIESGCGVSIPPEDSCAIAEAIKKLMNMSSSEREKMGKRGREYVIDNHDYKILAKRFLEAIND
jgi:glycosyltransferase involved in cell wall biosynthesis